MNTELAINFFLGLFVGAYGSLVGAGGGFILVPLFLLAYNLEPKIAAGTSMAIVFANACSGALAYLRIGKVDLKTGILFALATFPGAYLGVQFTSHVSKGVFSKIFAVLLIGIAIYLFRRKPAKSDLPVGVSKNAKPRTIHTKHGDKYHYYVNEALGGFLSIFVGFFSSAVGIGGGIIHVPLLTEVLKIPVPIAVATSHFILCWTALVGALSYYNQGNVDLPIFGSVGLGVVIGALIGVKLSKQFKGERIMHFLALGLIALGIRLLFV